jgi:hypothetical protein
MIDVGPAPRIESDTRSGWWRPMAPLLFALGLSGAVLGGLLVGYEPVGGDPDRLYRPLKSELERSLAEDKLPFWSDRFGLGVPLLAESHVAAFYPPNVVLYRFLSVSAAYRLSMWLHYVTLVAATYAYACSLGLTRHGAALSGVTFTFCGFQAIHSSHEPFYSAMPYLPLALCLVERWITSGKPSWLALLSFALGMQWTLGHFQIQAWTNGLVVSIGVWHAIVDRRSWVRTSGVIAAAACGAALAAVQLGPSWQLAALAGQTARPARELLYSSFPPLHWFELALPRLIRDLKLGPEDPYWFLHQTWGYEAALYVGTIPLIFALIGLAGRPRSRSTTPWRVIVLVSFGLATLPWWWPQAYLRLLAIPGFGFFRVPARYTLFTSLGLSLMAGEGLDHAIAKQRFRLGLAAAIVFGVCAATAAVFWSTRAEVNLRSTVAGVPDGFLWAAVAWSVGLATTLAWRFGRIASWVPLTVAAVELGVMFYSSTTQWGWAVAIPDQSPVLSELLDRPGRGLIGGETENLPVRAGMGSAYPHLGFEHTYPNKLLVFLQDPLVDQNIRRSIAEVGTAETKRWLRRYRVSHLVGSHASFLLLGKELSQQRDFALDQVVHRSPDEPFVRAWSLIELDKPFEEARVAVRARTIADLRALLRRLSRSDDLDIAWFFAEDHVPERPDGRSARLLSWDGTIADVEHDGPCDLVIARSHDPGWTARINGGIAEPVLPVDGGFQAVRLEGSGRDRITFSYRPARLSLWVAISSLALAAIVVVLAVSLVSWVNFQKRPSDRSFSPL